MPAVITVGDMFGTLQEVQEKMVAYEKDACVTYYISDSRTIENAAKTAPKIAAKAKQELQYYYLVYACIHGGRKFKSRSKGDRPNQSTFRQECKSRIRFVLSDDGQHLLVKDLNSDHNHIVNDAAFKHLPRQRKLDAESKKEAALLLGLKANKKMVQEHLQMKTGKIILLRDLSNIRVAGRTRPDNELVAAVQLLEESDGASVVAATTDDGQLLGLFFQDRPMKQTFQDYPELLLIDATYKLTDVRMPLYLLLVVDGNGESEIVGSFLVSDETRGTIATMVQAFKQCNSAWDSVQAIMSDKDFVERSVMRDEFPKASLLICLFHVLRTFRREVTCERMGIRPPQRDLCLEILQKIVYSESSDAYDRNVQMLQSTGIESVYKYFRDNWAPIKEEFVECFKGRILSLGNRTNNRLESINEKIKSVCSKHSSLSVFYKELMLIFHSLRVERDHRAMLVIQKRLVSSYIPGSIEALYLELLTPFAFAMVKRHIATHGNVKILQSVDGDSFEVEFNAIVVCASVNSCSCLFKSSTGLPCRHMFAVRCHKNISVFDTDIVARRWTRNYYAGHQQAVCGHSAPNETQLSITAVSKPPILTAHQKFRMASIVATELATLVSEAPMRHFDYRLQQMRDLCSAWKADRETAVKVLHDARMDTESCDEAINDMVYPAIDEVEGTQFVMGSSGMGQSVMPDMPYSAGLLTSEATADDHRENASDSEVVNEVVSGNGNYLNSNAIAVAATVTSGISESFESSAAVDDMYAEIGQCVSLSAFATNNSVNIVCSNSPQIVDTIIEFVDSDAITEIGASLKDGEPGCNTPSDFTIEDITLPPKICKRGRPKGAEKTVIGLPKKRKPTSKLLPFVDMTLDNKEEKILSWLFNPSFVQRVLEGLLIGPDDIRQQANTFTTALLDDNVEIKIIKKLFTREGWLALNAELKDFKKQVSFFCCACSNDIGQAVSICCDCCLLWCHLACTGLNKPPKKKHWFCKTCSAKANS